MPVMTGIWNHNSYLVTPTPAQFAAPAPPPPPPPPASNFTDAYKWAKGTFIIGSGTTSKGKLVFVAGVAELEVDFSFDTIDGQTVFKGQGVGVTGPLKGVVYNLLGWPKVDPAGNVTEVAGGILAVSGGITPPGAGLGGQPIGTVGYFKLSQ